MFLMLIICALLFAYNLHIAYFKTPALLNTCYNFILTSRVGERKVIVYVKQST